MQTKTCGRDAQCDIVLEKPGIEPLHASLELADDGLVRIIDAGSDSGTFLKRNDVWVRVIKVILCIGDRIRFADVEVSIDRLVSVFGDDSNARLEAKHFSPGHVRSGTRLFVKHHDHGPVMQKPRRNPTTGKIEEDRA